MPHLLQGKMLLQVARLHSLLAKHGIAKVRALLNNLPTPFRSAKVQLQPILARSRQPLHPLAALRQSKGRWYTTHSSINANASARRFTSSAVQKSGVKYDRSSFPKSRIGTIVNQSTGRAPFASTLRPNLTGGTLGRTAGGYGFGGGSARYFSHTPAAPAQVVQNVSQAVRAFIISGQKAQYDGVNSHTGEKRYKAVSTLQKNVRNKVASLPKATPGSYVDFSINPTITALTPLNSVPGYTMNAQHDENLRTEGLLDALAVDFSRALMDLSVILNDMKRLTELGDLPITYHTTSLRVNFPGCDINTVRRLCDELGIKRGTIMQDEDFDAFVGTEIALLFPFAPSKTGSEFSFYEKPVEERIIRHPDIEWRNMLSADICSSVESEDGDDYEEMEVDNPWLSSPSGYESLGESDFEGYGAREECNERKNPLEYQGFEGIYRFMEQCGSH